MKIIIPTPRFRNPKIYANIPAFHVKHPSPSDPGYVITGRGAHKREKRKPSPLPNGQIDYLRMTPAQRAEFDEWIRNTWDVAPPDPAYFDQIIHGVEADMMLNPEPSHENIPLLSYLLGFYFRPLMKRKQFQRVLSLARWAALGNNPGELLQVIRRAPWFEVADINSDLSVLQKHGHPLPARMAYALGLVFDYQRKGMHPSECDLTVSEHFVNMFNERWPDGIVLQAPKVGIPIIHLPRHPDTAAQVNKDTEYYTRDGGDFLADQQQFAELLAFWDEWKAMAAVDVPAKLFDPGLRKLVAVPPTSLAEILKSRVYDAAASFLTTDEIAVALGAGEIPGFDFDVTLQPKGIFLSVDAINAFFTFMLRTKPQNGGSADRHVIGSAVATFGAAGQLSFLDIDVRYPRKEGQDR